MPFFEVKKTASNHPLLFWTDYSRHYPQLFPALLMQNNAIAQSNITFVVIKKSLHRLCVGSSSNDRDFCVAANQLILRFVTQL